MIKEPTLINDYIEQLISEPLNPTFLTAVFDAKITVSANITEKCQAEPNACRRKRYIRLQLCRLVRTADTLYVEVCYEEHRSLKKALLIMLELINEVNDLLPECDPQVMLPKVELDRARKQYHPQLRLLMAKLASYDMDPELISLSLKPLKKFLDRKPGPRHSKHDFCYLQKHMKGLNSIGLYSSQPESISDVLLDLFIGLNYNSLEVFHYCISHMLKRTSVCTGNPGETDHPKPEQTDHLKGRRKLSKFAGEDFQFSG